MEEMKRGRLFVVSGPSGTGKSAICAGLTADENTMLSVSMTTRAPRAYEEEGKNYFFVDKEKFKASIAEGGFFEYAEVFGEFYGTPKAPVLRQLAYGNDVILEIETDGAKQVRAAMPDAVLIFILPPSLEELKRRIESRGTETPERIAGRLGRGKSEIAQIGNYDYYVVNDKLDDAISDVLCIMRAETLCGTSRPGQAAEPKTLHGADGPGQAAGPKTSPCADGQRQAAELEMPTCANEQGQAAEPKTQPCADEPGHAMASEDIEAIRRADEMRVGSDAERIIARYQ